MPDDSAIYYVLSAAVAERMPAADEATVAVVAATAGLLACVAYADRDFGEEEQQRVRDQLACVLSFSAEDAVAMCDVVRSNIEQITAGDSLAFSEVLLPKLDLDRRVELLEALIDLATADDVVVNAETDTVRGSPASCTSPTAPTTRPSTGVAARWLKRPTTRPPGS